MKYLFVLLLTFSCGVLFAQRNKELKEYFLLYNKEGVSVRDFDSAATFKAITKENDSTYVVRYYENNGPMIWRQTFKDAQFTISNGWFAWYDKNGNIEEAGRMLNGKKDGSWRTYDGSEKDSTLNITYFSNGKLVKNISNDKHKKNRITIQTKAEYKNGVKGWQKYLMRHLNKKIGTNIPLYKKLTNHKACVNIAFLIDTNGTANGFLILNSAGYPFDNETIRVIKNSDKWTPAQQNGHAVVYRQKQKIIFAY